MRRLSLLLTPVLAATAHASPVPAEAPIRMAGLWLMNTTPSGRGADSSFHICIGAPARDDVLAHPAAPCRTAAKSAGAGRALHLLSGELRGQGRQRGGRGEVAGDFRYNFRGGHHDDRVASPAR